VEEEFEESRGQSRGRLRTYLMGFDWSQYLTLAKQLATATEEASLRSAISRSYYCAFNLAKARAEQNGYRDPQDNLAGGHENLWGLYSRNGASKACSDLAVLGPRMKHRRVRADYRPNFHRLKDGAKDAIEDAEKCVELLSSLPADMPKDIGRTWSYSSTH
jgi:hypothetical protein